MNDIHDLIQAEYEKDNYKIEYNSCKNGLAYIYCSSNALYEKDNLQSFEDKIINLFVIFGCLGMLRESIVGLILMIS